METAIANLEARSLAYAFFARSLVHPQGGEWLPELVEWPMGVAKLLSAAGLEVSVERLENLRSAFLAGEEPGTLREECVRLFGNLRGAGCSPYETEFSNAHVFQRGQELADVAGFYLAFGLEPSAEGERADHIAAELEFMHFLIWKELQARERPDHQELCREAQSKFLADHLGRWTGVFAQLVARTSTEPFYVELTRLLDEFVVADSAALGASPERIAGLPRRPRREEEEAEEARASCGVSSDFVEISQLGGKP